MNARQGGAFRRVEEHMTTMVSLAGRGIDDGAADAFFARIARLEDVLSRFRPHSDLARFARGELDLDRADPAVRTVLARCEALRDLTGGDFDHEPRRRGGSIPADPLLDPLGRLGSTPPHRPTLDVDAVAKGWIVEDAATILRDAVRCAGAEFLVNAGGDISASHRAGGEPWRVGVQHPVVRAAVLGTFAVAAGAVATSGAYERGEHLRTSRSPSLTSVTVVGPELATADGLATAVYASGQSPPDWWRRVDGTYGLLTLGRDDQLRWLPPTVGADVEWSFPAGSAVARSVAWEIVR